MKIANRRARPTVRFLLAVLVLGWGVAMSAPRAAADSHTLSIVGPADSHTLVAVPASDSHTLSAPATSAASPARGSMAYAAARR